MRNPGRTALLIHCSREEAETIRHAARVERRTVSGYVVNAVMNRIAMREKMLQPNAPAVARVEGKKT